MAATLYSSSFKPQQQQRPCCTIAKSPTLYRLAANRQYDKIPAHVQSHPDDLAWTDRYGSTALHILCQARAVDRLLLAAVDAILRHAPEQVCWGNVATWTPLHFAVEKRLLWGGDSYATSLILRLIRACPEAVSVRTQTGFKTKTPFHIACEADADYLVLKAMLSINPSLATEPFVKTDVYSVTENPLQLLWKHNHSGSSASHIQQTEAKMALLLQAAHYGSVQMNHNQQIFDHNHHCHSQGIKRRRSFRLLNAACSVRCPRDYFTKMLQSHAAQVHQPDEDGLLPIHYAVKNAQADSQAYTQFVVEHLLLLYPAGASIPDTNGRLPLHVVVSDTCMTWHKGGVRELTYSYPNALRQADPSSGLVPFLASAVSANKSRLHLSTTYELLLAAPEMVQPWKNTIQEEGAAKDENNLNPNIANERDDNLEN